MNQQEAYQTLDIAQGADVMAIRQKYQELYQDYQLRITNAPTPNLKQKYEQQLNQIEEAYRLLSGSGNNNPYADMVTDHVSSTPQPPIVNNAPTVVPPNYQTPPNYQQNYPPPPPNYQQNYPPQYPQQEAPKNNTMLYALVALGTLLFVVAIWAAFEFGEKKELEHELSIKPPVVTTPVPLSEHKGGESDHTIYDDTDDVLNPTVDQQSHNDLKIEGIEFEPNHTFINIQCTSPDGCSVAIQPEMRVVTKEGKVYPIKRAKHVSITGDDRTHIGHKKVFVLEFDAISLTMPTTIDLLECDGENCYNFKGIHIDP